LTTGLQFDHWTSVSVTGLQTTIGNQLLEASRTINKQNNSVKKSETEIGKQKIDKDKMEKKKGW
jgi:hypothetical protein